jgi:hypothetical protein
MMAFAMLLIGSGLVVNVADTVPRYDMKPTCRAAVDLPAFWPDTKQRRKDVKWFTKGHKGDNLV